MPIAVELSSFFVCFAFARIHIKFMPLNKCWLRMNATTKKNTRTHGRVQTHSIKIMFYFDCTNINWQLVPSIKMRNLTILFCAIRAFILYPLRMCIHIIQWNLTIPHIFIYCIYVYMYCIHKYTICGNYKCLRLCCICCC